VLGHFLGPLDIREDVVSDHAPLAQNSYSRTVSIEHLAFVSKLLQLDFGHLEESLDLVAGSLKVGHGKGVDGDDLDAERIRHFEDAGQGDEALAVALEGFHAPVARVPPVAVHHKRDMFRDGTALERAEQKAIDLSGRPLAGRRLHDPVESLGHCRGVVCE
jgi:hypothetical protein